MLLIQGIESKEWHIVKELTVKQEQSTELTWEGRPYSTYCRHELKQRPKHITANTSISIVTCSKCLKAWNDALRALREVDLIYSTDQVGNYKVEVMEMGCSGCDQYKWLIHDIDGNYVSTASGPRVDPKQCQADGITYAQELIRRDENGKSEKEAQEQDENKPK